MDGTEVELEALSRLTQIRNDDQWTPKVQVELRAVRLLLQVKVFPEGFFVAT